MSRYARRRRVRRVASLLTLVTLIGSMVFTLAGTASGTHGNPPNLFELEGNAIDDPAGGPTDWDTVGYDGVQAVFVPDEFTGPNSDDIFTEGSKDIQDVSAWCWKLGNEPDKDGITNAYADLRFAGGETYLYLGADRFATNGDAQIGFWLLKGDVTKANTRGDCPNQAFEFTGNHEVGDVLVLSDFTNGGDVSTISVFAWNGTAPVLVGSGTVDCSDIPLGTNDDACATVNDADAPAPWATDFPVPGATQYVPKFGDAGTFPAGAFFEGGVNLSAFFDDLGCFNTFIAETRSSQEIGADLKDLALGSFETCGLSVTKTGDTKSKIGDPASYTITVSNDGLVTLYKQSIVDDVIGDLTDGTNASITGTTCGASLAPGATCTINLSYTVQPDDPDPLINTVEAIYDTSAGLAGDEVSASDSHTLELFQPSVVVDKTGDLASKVGDPVAYTFTVTNTSSADSPPLVNGTIVDSLLGDLLDPANPYVTGGDCTATLAVGASCTITASRTVLAGDPDPLPNTVTVHYNPQGFPNDITDTDDHSVELFQPQIVVTKTGDGLSKVGDPVSYTVMISNTSSSDTPLLVNGTVVDSLAGDLLDPDNPYVTSSTCGTTLATGASCTITYTLTVPVGASDPMPNTVEVHFNPQGFPNDITDSDDHSVNLFQPSVQVTKTGDALGKVTDPVTYTITVTNTSSADSPPLVNGTVVDSLLGDLLDPANPYVTSNDCTAILEVGATCTIIAVRTVQAGDPDPLPNTVTATYNPFGFPNIITGSAQHDVNLFQPGVALSKVCDSLSKVGDPVSCTVTVTNTSSDDSPDLTNGSLDDTIAGDLLDAQNPLVTASDCDGSLEPGEACTVGYTFIVAAGSPDPLVNTVEVHFNPEGFPNDITATATWNTNLFQPAVEVVKTGDELAGVGDPVDYQFVVTNQSSSDSPALVNGTIVDSLLGDLLDPANPYVTGGDCTATLAVGDSCTITATRVVLVTDPDPLPNTVTVHYNPEGFPNDITDTDDHSVNLFGPAVEVVKTGDTLGKVTDPVDYQFVITNTSTADSPALVNASIVDSLLGDLLDPANPYVTASTCTSTLEVGAACAITATRIVQAGDPDPLPNTVVVSYNPVGSDNVVTDDDDHTVNLFQPSVDVVKSGDQLSKVGDPAAYTVTITNTSSADSPALVNGTVDDTLAGDLLDPQNALVTSSTCSTTLAVGASCAISYTLSVPVGAADPMPNTVTVHYNPTGFPNDITDSDDHSVNLFQPSVDVVKISGGQSKIGDPIDYTVTVTNTSSADSPVLVNGSIVDSLAGDLLDAQNVLVTSSDCTASLAVGASCTITYTYTVAAGDPDPLPNTVTVHYNPDGFPNDITDTASVDTNLFQPSVTVDKTGDALGKVGDPVDYQFVITNTSSDDSPDLVDGTVVDSLLGDLLDPANPYVTSSDCTTTLAVGASCTITATRVVQAGDPDPLPNTVTVHYNPEGFPNDITDTDDHSVNLFQPSVTVDKTGDELGKVTDPAHYTVTITNTSSDDSPDLVDGTVVDSLTGDLLDPDNTFVTSSDCVDGELEPGESCTIEYEYVVQAGDPDPLVNSVEVHFHPVGFDNDITATDTHTMELFQPSVTVDKTGDDVASRGDEVEYQFVVTNTSSDDSPRLVNGTIVDSLLGDLLDPANPYVTSSDCDGTLEVGASCTITAARVVETDDPNPLPNTVTVHFNPEGFPNDITDDDDHSVELLPEPTVLTVPPTTTPPPEPTTSTTVGGRLPFTGGGASFAGLGLLLLAGGLALVGGTRRRRRLGTDGG
ncbi:MAG TPA: hypothetical protein VFZ83_15705 [Acidimicrobiia bacterium]|nr:hypothetical protein [Acidimicrobiia bacterium]